MQMKEVMLRKNNMYRSWRHSSVTGRICGVYIKHTTPIKGLKTPHFYGNKLYSWTKEVPCMAKDMWTPFLPF